MSSKSKIEWTESTWQPIAGCTKCSPGCDNCYAERMAYRLACMGQKKYQATTGILGYMRGWNGKIYCDEKALEIPLHWRKPRRIFVCSMSDLFHPKVPFEFIEKVMAVIEECPQHTFQILTKRPHIMFEYFSGIGKLYELSCCPNVHLGVSICTPDEMWKADELRKILAAVRFISFEPLLADVGDINLEGIGQVIVGGESGPGARPMHPDWARNIRDQCVPNGIPFFFKQHGEWLSGADKYALKINTYNFYPKRVTRIGNTTFFRVTKKLAGRMLDGREWQEYPK